MQHPTKQSNGTVNLDEINFTKQSDEDFKMYILRLFEEINFFHLKKASNCNIKIETNETAFGYTKELITNPVSD